MPQQRSTPPLRVGFVLFDGFELLDVFGPAEIFGLLTRSGRTRLTLLGADGAGPVTSAQGVRVLADRTCAGAPEADVLIVPGGQGTRREVENGRLLAWLREADREVEVTASVCTGSALLARAGLLDGRRATSNKAAFDWVREQGPHVTWVRQARWVEDGKFWTSSGVSAGIDMALALMARLLGRETADRVAQSAEYRWNPDPDADPFA